MAKSVYVCLICLVVHGRKTPGVFYRVGVYENIGFFRRIADEPLIVLCEDHYMAQPSPEVLAQGRS